MVEQLTLGDDEDDDEEKNKKQPPESPEEIRRRQQRELEEKQRRYQEARAKIFGESNPSSRQSSPGSVTPPEGRLGNHGHRGRGRGRGGRGRGDRDRDRDGGRQDRRQPQSGGETRELYDPRKGGYNVQRRGDASSHQGS